MFIEESTIKRRGPRKDGEDGAIDGHAGTAPSTSSVLEADYEASLAASFADYRGASTPESVEGAPTGTATEPARTLSGRSAPSVDGSSVSGSAANLRRRMSDGISAGIGAGGGMIRSRLSSLTTGVMQRSASLVMNSRGRSGSSAVPGSSKAADGPTEQHLKDEAAELNASIDAAKRMSKDELRALIG